jgi:hypothetical protein
VIEFKMLEKVIVDFHHVLLEPRSSTLLPAAPSSPQKLGAVSTMSADEL